MALSRLHFPNNIFYLGDVSAHAHIHENVYFAQIMTSRVYIYPGVTPCLGDVFMQKYTPGIKGSKKTTKHKQRQKQ